MLAAQLMAVPALGALALGAGAVVASVGSLVLPFYAGYKLHKRLERRRSAKRRRRAREAMWHKLEDMRWRGVLAVLYWLLQDKPFDAHCCHMGTAIKHPVPD